MPGAGSARRRLAVLLLYSYCCTLNREWVVIPLTYYRVIERMGVSSLLGVRKDAVEDRFLLTGRLAKRDRIVCSNRTKCTMATHSKFSFAHFLTIVRTSSSSSTWPKPTLCGWCFTLFPYTIASLNSSTMVL